MVLNTISSKTRIFYPDPYNASVGWTCKDATSTNPGVATVDARGYIQYGGKTGEATLSVKGPDGKTKTKTVQVYNYFTHVDISGISAPVIGETFDYTAEVPADAPYHVTKVEWARGSTGLRGYGSYEDITESSVADYWEPYTVYVTIAPDDFTEFHESESSLTFTVDNADGSQDTKYWEGWANQDYDEEIYDYVDTYTFSYTFPGISKYDSSTSRYEYADEGYLCKESRTYERPYSSEPYGDGSDSYMQEFTDVTFYNEAGEETRTERYMGTKLTGYSEYIYEDVNVRRGAVYDYRDNKRELDPRSTIVY